MAVAFRQVWPDAAAGAIDPTDLGLRRLVVSADVMSGAGAKTIWTNDGTATGQVLTGPALVWTMVQDQKDGSAYGLTSASGLKIPSGDPGGSDNYHWETASSGGVLTTKIYAGQDENSMAQGDGAGRRFFAYALPEPT